MKKGLAGNMAGCTSPENDVPLGSGQLNIFVILKAANKAGVKHYYIKDESNRVDVQVPQKMAYLQGL